MANSRSALKRVRKTRTQTSGNNVIRSRVKTYRRRVLAAIESKDSKAAKAALSEFASAADKAGRQNIIHRNSADRLKSDLTRRVQALG